jgi:hypothetical protein
MYRLAQTVPSGVSTVRMRYLGGQTIPLRLSQMGLSNRFRWEAAVEVFCLISMNREPISLKADPAEFEGTDELVLV